jgi:hypothetical protein
MVPINRGKQLLLGGVLVALVAATALWTRASPARAPDVHRLAVTEAALDYCRQAWPAALPAINERVRQLSQGISKGELNVLREGDDYLRAHASMEQFVARVDPRNARSVCTGPLISSGR